MLAGPSVGQLLACKHQCHASNATPVCALCTTCYSTLIHTRLPQPLLSHPLLPPPPLSAYKGRTKGSWSRA
jgi:hypothetical protein